MAAQPLVSPRYRLLYAAWNYHGLKLDIYGLVDDDGAEVYALTQKDSNVDLEVALDLSVFDAAQAWVDKVGPQQLRESRAEARVERAEWARQSAQFAQR